MLLKTRLAKLHWIWVSYCKLLSICCESHEGWTDLELYMWWMFLHCNVDPWSVTSYISAGMNLPTFDASFNSRLPHHCSPDRNSVIAVNSQETWFCSDWYGVYEWTISRTSHSSLSSPHHLLWCYHLVMQQTFIPVLPNSLRGSVWSSKASVLFLL